MVYEPFAEAAELPLPSSSSACLTARIFQLLPGEACDIIRVVGQANVVDWLLGGSARCVLEHAQRGPPGVRSAGVEVLIQHEVRRWRHEVIPDLADGVESPR